MPESKKTKLTGQVISTEIGSKEISYSDYSRHENLYWIDIGLKLIEGHVINIYYSFERSSIRNNINNSIKKGMTVTVTVNEQVDIEKNVIIRVLEAYRYNIYLMNWIGLLETNFAPQRMTTSPVVKKILFMNYW